MSCRRIFIHVSVRERNQVVCAVVVALFPWHESFLKNNLVVVANSDPLGVSVVCTKFPVEAAFAVTVPLIAVILTDHWTYCILGDMTTFGLLDCSNNHWVEIVLQSARCKL